MVESVTFDIEVLVGGFASTPTMRFGDEMGILAFGSCTGTTDARARIAKSFSALNSACGIIETERASRFFRLTGFVALPFTFRGGGESLRVKSMVTTSCV